ncbi:MAG: DUF4173 domain-containing protein [Clostridia bacterium]|nr:DUF4173 domain-containing protein [Clostridia bacterium]
MNEPMPAAHGRTDVLAAPVMRELKQFSASKQEILTAAGMYLLAYLYLRIGYTWQLPVFTAGFILITELLSRNVTRSKENLFWLFCLILTAAARTLNRCTAWEDGGFLVLHAFAVWYVLSREDLFVQGESSPMILQDALNGLILIPFGHFFLRIRTVWFGLTNLRKRREGNGRSWLWTAGTVLLAGCLFILAVHLLIEADDGFAGLLSGVSRLFENWHFELDPEWVLSLPVGAYLFGLIAGGMREDRDRLRESAQRTMERVGKLRRVENRVWTILAVCFCLTYGVFFIVQFRYLFSAFVRELPEGFIVSRYARQGFFELCGVMGVNFLLLILMEKMSLRPVREDRAALTVLLILLLESLLFAAVAASKLILYIDCFGFTPRRLQSSWAVSVLAAGCVCMGRSKITGRGSFKIWLFYSAASAAALCLF